MSVPLLDIRHVDAYYGPVQALRDVSINVYEGEIVCLIGANGAGKSTLLMTLFGMPRPEKGEICYKGENITTDPSHAIAGKGIALVPEGRHVFPGMTVEENLMMGTIPVSSVHSDEDIRTMYTMFPRLQERAAQRAGTLSGGEQQMLAIARALMSRPELLLLDEPSLGLAPIIVKRIFDKLREIASKGTTIFLVEQNANQALRLADRGYVLVNGEIRLSGTGDELFNNPEVRKAYLGGQ